MKKRNVRITIGIVVCIIIVIVGLVLGRVVVNVFNSTYGEDISDGKTVQEIMKDEGMGIDVYVSQVFLTKHPYVGDMSANNNTAKAIGIHKDFDYENELQTDEEPYGWTLVLTKDPALEAEALEQKTKAYAYTLMAMVGNLEVVTFEGTDGNILASYTADEASEALGQDIKEYGDTAVELQKLMTLVGLMEE